MGRRKKEKLDVIEVGKGKDVVKEEVKEAVRIVLKEEAEKQKKIEEKVEIKEVPIVVENRSEMLSMSVREFLSIVDKRIDRRSKGIGRAFLLWCRGRNYKFATGVAEWDKRLSEFLGEPV